jgi:competence ComEA-like helix-hairpin-helix protein
VLEWATDGQWKVIRPTGVPSPGGAGTASQLVHLNSASAAELVALPMIGPGRAQAIVAFREAHGPFTSVGDLTNVPGIRPSGPSVERGALKLGLPTLNAWIKSCDRSLNRRIVPLL